MDNELYDAGVDEGVWLKTGYCGGPELWCSLFISTGFSWDSMTLPWPESSIFRTS